MAEFRAPGVYIEKSACRRAAVHMRCPLHGNTSKTSAATFTRERCNPSLSR